MSDLRRPDPDLESEAAGSGELVAVDDRIIGVVFRRSLLVVAAAAIAAAVIFALIREDQPVEVIYQRAPIEAPQELATDEVDRPELPFTDITAAAGLRFERDNGARGEKLLPETMGGGGALADLDRDGDPDLVLVDGGPWQGGGGPRVVLYRNQSGGRFSDVTATSGIAISGHGMGVAVGDVDNDGREDLFVTSLGRNTLWRNLGDLRFEEVTDRAGVAGGGHGWSTSAGFFDADSDGWLDLFVATYVQWTRELDLELNFTLNGKDRAYGPPTQYPGAHCVLYRNLGDGTFEDISETAGIRVLNSSTGRAKGKALAVTFADVDGNGSSDIFVANDTVENFLFLNRGDGTFDEVGRAWGVATDSNGNATGAMGVDMARQLNDERLAIAVGNFANEASSLFVQTASRGTFADLANLSGVGSESRLRLSFGLLFVDVDLDGHIDLLQANGHLENEINEVHPSQTYRQAAQLFWNTGRRRRAFVALDDAHVSDLARPIVGRGITAADIDGDGDLDLLLLQPAGPPLLLRNDQTTGHHWLRVVVEGGHGVNRSAIGTRLELEAGGRVQWRQVMPTRSYLSQTERVVTFGLGASATVDRLTVLWPDGRRQEVAVEGSDREMTVRRTAH